MIFPVAICTLSKRARWASAIRAAIILVATTSLPSTASSRIFPARRKTPTKEDSASCTAFFEDLKRRGLPDLLLAITDGAPGLIRAVETCFPRAMRRRCLVHRLRNLLTEAPDPAGTAAEGV